ncbi:response regulator [Pseudomonas spelaei]
MLSSDVASQELMLMVPSPAHWRHLCVLVVEDHSTYRTMMGWFLQKFGLRHELVEDGRSALVAIARRRFDLVISDCQMPCMDGYTMARAIRLHERALGHGRVPIIALTGNLVHDDPQRCRNAGMDAWLLKPLTLEQLREVLMHWLPGPPHVQPPLSPAMLSVAWPTRASLIEMFGSAQVVEQMLGSLLIEASEDSAALAHARMTLNPSLTAQRLHRLVGSLAFLGAADLEVRGSMLIAEVRAHGVVLNKPQLEAFQRDLVVYLTYLSTL